MIDIENLVFSNIAAALRAQFANIYVTGENAMIKSKFPAVCIAEIDNSVYERTLDASGAENHATLLYQIDVYSNLTSGKKSQAKSIAAVVDEQMMDMGFCRTAKQPIEFSSDSTSIYRLSLRYKATVAKGVTVGGNTVYQTYKK